MKTYKILITGTGVSGKSNLARKLQEDLSKCFSPITAKDIDWDEQAEVIPEDSLVYILQTPKGCTVESQHYISPYSFDRILYSDPDQDTYIRFLASRGCAWFREGVVERGLDHNPTPYSTEKLPQIIERVIGYALRRDKLRTEDLQYFNSPGLVHKVTFIKPRIVTERELFFEGYAEVLEQIITEVEYNPFEDKRKTVMR